jgi:hypothetical protein
VTFTAVVASSPGAPPDGQSVSFAKGMTQLGNVNVEWRFGYVYDLDTRQTRGQTGRSPFIEETSRLCPVFP